jgi:succinoglycan biosynthesis protein ExoA
MEAQRKTVVVLPTLNDNATILNVVESMLADPAADAVWVIDGGSIDGTPNTVRAYLSASPRLKLIDNPDRTEAHAVNLAARLAEEQGFDTLVRVTAQGLYPPGFVTSLVAHLGQSEAASIVVPAMPARYSSDSAWSMAGADLHRSGLARVDSALRYGTRDGGGHEGQHAAFDLAVFRALGGYDTNFSACEDIDFDMRLLQAGHRIWFAARLPVQILPRSNPRAFLRQMIVTGRWRLICARKYRHGLPLRQLLPLVAVVASLASLVAAATFGPKYALVAILYCTLVVCVALSVRGQSGVLHGLRIGWLALVGHTGFTFGLLSGCLIRPRAARPAVA